MAAVMSEIVLRFPDASGRHRPWAPPSLPLDPGAVTLQRLDYRAAVLFVPSDLTPPIGDALSLAYPTDAGGGPRAVRGTVIGRRAPRARMAPAALIVEVARPDPAFVAWAERVALRAAPAAAGACADRQLATRCALVIDDDALARSMLSDALRRRGFEVLVASGGSEGFSILSSELFRLDVVVTDVCMPGMAGDELVEVVRCAGRETDLAIVAMTASATAERVRRLESCGVDAVLSKSAGADVIAETAAIVARRAA